MVGRGPWPVAAGDDGLGTEFVDCDEAGGLRVFEHAGEVFAEDADHAVAGEGLCEYIVHSWVGVGG